MPTDDEILDHYIVELDSLIEDGANGLHVLVDGSENTATVDWWEWFDGDDESLLYGACVCQEAGDTWSNVRCLVQVDDAQGVLEEVVTSLSTSTDRRAVEHAGEIDGISAQFEVLDAGAEWAAISIGDQQSVIICGSSPVPGRIILRLASIELLKRNSIAHVQRELNARLN